MSTQREELRKLSPGRLLTTGDIERLLGSVPPQSEINFTVRGLDRRMAFRRHRVNGREAWEVM